MRAFSLARLLNQSPEFYSGGEVLPTQSQDEQRLPSKLVAEITCAPEPIHELELDQIAALDAVSAAWEKLFGSGWLPPSQVRHER